MDVYDKLLNHLDSFKPSDVPEGLDSFVDMVAQIYNGGAQQWVTNEYADDADEVRGLLGGTSDPGVRELRSLLGNLPSAESVREELDEAGEDEDYDFEVAQPEYMAVEKFIYDEAKLHPVIEHVIKDNPVPATAALYPMPQPVAKKKSPAKKTAAPKQKKKATPKTASQRMVERHKLAEASDAEDLDQALRDLHKQCMQARRALNDYDQATLSVQDLNARQEKMAEDIRMFADRLKKVI